MLPTAKKAPGSIGGYGLGRVLRIGPELKAQGDVAGRVKAKDDPIGPAAEERSGVAPCRGANGIHPAHAIRQNGVRSIDARAA